MARVSVTRLSPVYNLEMNQDEAQALIDVLGNVYFHGRGDFIGKIYQALESAGLELDADGASVDESGIRLI